jgi:hypothetical protein
MTTNETTTTISHKPLPVVGQIDATSDGVVYIVTGHTDAGAIIETDDGEQHTLAPKDYPPLPKVGSAVYRAFQLLTRDRSWIDGDTQTVITEDEADQEAELLREFPPAVAAIMQIGNATRAAMLTEGIVLRAGVIESLAAANCADATDSATGFELVSALKTWLEAGTEAQRNADRWQDEITRPIFDAFKRATGFKGYAPDECRDAIVAYLSTGKPPAPAEQPTMPLLHDLAHELVNYIRGVAKDAPASPALPLNAIVDGVRVSPFYIAQQRGWALMQQIEAATEAVKKQGNEEAAQRYTGMLKECFDGWHAIAAELDNMDGEFHGGGE